MDSGIGRGKVNLPREFRKNIRKGVSLLLSAAMVVGSVSFSNVGAVDVSAAEKSKTTTAPTGTYAMGSGQKINSSTLFNADTGYGFSDVNFPDEAKDWVGGVYYPREEKVTAGSASYVTDGEGYLEITSRIWTETESTGYGVYTYENTSTLDFALDNTDYKISVELVNPTDKELVVSLEAENITKASGVKVAAGATVTQDITACLVDGVLNLKFLETSGSATKEEEAVDGKVYVSKVTITKAATRTAGEKPTIFIASDSTVQTYETAEAPKTGWGQTLYNFFGDFIEERSCSDCGYSQSRTYETENVIIENRAIGGRSSKSFIEEGKFDDLLEDVKPGDYVLVQWGHNDATAARPNRYVSPADFEYWMQYYVDGVTQRGATPVLVTPVARYSYVTNADGSVTFVGNFEKYGDVMRKMAKEQDIPIVDLTASSVALCNDFGLEGAKSLFMVHAGDTTHLQYYGAYKFAQCVAQGIVDYAEAGATDKLDELAALVVNKIPTKEPGVVSGFRSTTVGSSSVGLTWDEEADSELYYIYRAVLSDGQTIDDVDFDSAEKFSVSSTNEYSDGACEAGVTYVYAVRGFNAKGLGAFSDKIQVTTKTAGWKFDINGDKDSIAKADGPTDDGWTGVGAAMYDAATGYGWITRPGAGRDRGVQDNTSYSLMGRDFTLGAGEFALDLPNGDYEVTCYGGDLLPGTSTVKTSFGAEGKSIGSISVKQGVAGATGTVRVEDGQLNITTDNYFNGFTVTEILKAPSSLEASEKSVSGSNMTFLLSFIGVDEAVSYNVYKKSSSDDSFTIVKTFTTEEYDNDDLGCRAMTAALGETYEYYMTCVTADGTESARSNIETVKAVLDDVKVPSAPSNVVCVDPTSSTTGVQHTITISWNAASVADADKSKVIKYIIYRSAKAENEKGFKGFEKVGETTETTYKDTYFDIDTNISYYYKVAALNAGGLSELSSVCKTPVTGTLTPGNLESYSDRALVAVNLAGEKGADTLISATDKDGNTLTKGVYLSWRSFGADFDTDNNLTTKFTVYRDGTAIATDISVTNMVDEGGTSASVYKVVGSNDSAIGVKAVDTKCWEHQYLELSLFAPADETMPEYNGEVTTCDYSANDMSLGDLDGDGVVELIVKWYPSNAKDNSGYGYTGKTFLDAYDVNWATGEVSLLYRIDMGINIRSGAHYTQFQVWDYDGDGKAEIAVKTAPGTTVLRPTDGTAATLKEEEFIDVASSTLPTEKISAQNDYRNASGFVLDGPEYFTMFNGEDGSILDTTDFVPSRGNVGAWGDAYGNRVDRFLSATAYLDGENPYAVFSRGYYTRTCLTAYYYNKDTKKIDVYWAFDTNEAGSEYESQGNHGLSVNDVDNDGKDEITYGSLTVDHDGTVKFSTGLGHGDAMHVSDWVEWNDGLEVMQVHEHDDATYHVEIHDAETGEILMGYWTGTDTGRGVAGDIDPTSAGAEWWAVAGPNYQGADEPSWDSTDGDIYSTQSKLGALIKLADKTPSVNATIFWDGDLLTEVQDHTFNKTAYAPTGVKLYKWDYENEKQVELLSSTEIWSSNGTKGNLGIIADFLGDWREEIIARCASDNNKVRVYTTTIQTDYVVPCLLENLAYREGVAWENVGYNQPANLSYLLSEGLITSQLTEGQITKKSVEIAFTEASDGKYGHEVTGYQIFRAEGDGEFELIDTISKDELVEYVPDKEQPEEPDEEEVLYSQDFESGESDFTLITAGNTAYEYLEKDTSTVNANTSDYVYGVGSRGGDTGTQKSGLDVNANATVEFDFKMDACAQNKSSNIALLGSANKANTNWLDSSTQILTICGTASGNGYWGSITINGEDITSTANVNAGTSNGESSGKGGLNRDTTGWLHITAGINFDTQTVDVKLTRVSDDSEVYSGTVNFVAADKVDVLDSIFMAAGKTYGGVFIDNIRIVDGIAETPEEPETPVSYVDVLYKQFDIGTKKGNADGFIQVGNDVYDAEKGYGFSEDTVVADFANKGTYIAVSDDSEAVEYACQDVAYAEKGKLEFKVDVDEAGTYTVNVYAGAFGGSAGATLSINGTDMGAIADSTKLTSASDIVKSLEVTVEDGGQITVICNNDSARAPLSAIVITKKVPASASEQKLGKADATEVDTEEVTEPSESETESAGESTGESTGEITGESTSEIASENESTGKADTEDVTESSESESEADTEDATESSESESEADTEDATESSESESEAEDTEDATEPSESESEADSTSEATSEKESTSEAYTEDVTEPSESESEAENTEELTISLNNVRAVTASESTEEDTVKYYSYVDKNVESDTTYRYKIAAVVDGKTSFMSRQIELHTLVDIASLDDFTLPELVQNQVLAAGQTLADLLPAQIGVTDTNGNKTTASVKWNVSDVDITTPGEYTVVGIIAGWDEPIVRNVTVVPNVMTGYAAFEDITVIVGNEPTLPSKITITYKNGTTKTETVSWDKSGLDIKTVGNYVLNGTSATVSDAKITVKVVDNYITSLYTRYCEIYLNDTEYTLPSDVCAVWADGTTSYVSAVWNAAASIDVTALGTTVLTGAVEGFDGAAQLQVTVEYPVAKRFDFGITGSAVEDGWIGIAANPKSGKKTVEELGIAYSESKGYGFLDGTKVFEGRDEGLYKVGGQLADNVYRDFIMPDGSTFRVDVPNGKYIVELVGGCSGGSSTVTAKVNGEDITVKNGTADYAINEIETVVTDGYIDVKFCGSLSRTCAVIVRTVSVDGKEEPEEPSTEEPTEEPTEAPTEKPSEEPTTEAPTEKPSEESTTEAPTENPSEETTTEAPTETPSEEPTTEEPTEAPSEEPTTEPPTEASSEETTTEASTEASTETTSKATGETTTAAPTEKATEASTKTTGDDLNYRGDVGEITDEVIPDAVKKMLNCSTVEEVVELLGRMITENSEAAKILPDIEADNTMVFDFVVKIKRSNGEWTVATEEELSAGVDVVLPYPENTSGDEFDFVVGHLIVSGDKAGTMEYFAPEETEEGLKINITSASPFVIGWKPAKNDEQPATEESSKADSEIKTAGNETSQKDDGSTVNAENSADKDGGNQIFITMLIVLAVIVVAAAAIAVAAKRRKFIKKK